MSKFANITNREYEALRLISTGCKRKHLARTMCISENTVADKTKNLRRKLGATTNAQAVAIAFRNGILL